jgi:nicotinate-nucleotide--dimethylbenzimidazole phosphoribosyltransferase
MKTFSIKPVSTSLEKDLRHKIDFKTKPLGALGQLEKIALQVGLIQNTLSPELVKPHILVFAGDHGIAEEGVSAYPQEVTWQMVMNFVQGGAAINIFCKQHQIELQVVDAGVNHSFDPALPVINAKVSYGTANFLKSRAMTREQLDWCFVNGASIVQDKHRKGCNVIGFGEMGIGNTAAASTIMSALFQLPVEQCTGRGTGLNDEALQHKIRVLSAARNKHADVKSPQDILATFGGFEIAQMTGAMLQAAELSMIVLVDGFISTVAYAVAAALNPQIREYAIFCHQSHEHAHGLLLKHLDAEPVLQLGMRLGEGTGAAVAYPLVQSAVMFLRDMASFESAGVSNKT